MVFVDSQSLALGALAVFDDALGQSFPKQAKPCPGPYIREPPSSDRPSPPSPTSPDL